MIMKQIPRKLKKHLRKCLELSYSDDMNISHKFRDKCISKNIYVIYLLPAFKEIKQYARIVSKAANEL